MPTETPPATEPTPAPATPPIPADSGSLISRIRISGREPSPQAISPEPTTPKLPEEPKEPTATPETEPKTESVEPPKEPEKPKVEPPKTEPPKEDPTAGMSEKAAVRFNKVETARKQAEQERDTARKELEEAKKRHEAMETQLREAETIRKNAERIEKQLAQYQEELRSVNLERDPEFQKKFDGQILSRQYQMVDMATQAGIDRNTVIAAINAADEDALTEFRDSLPAHKQRLWDANRADIERFAYDKREALRNSQKTVEDIEEERRKQWAEEERRRSAQNVTQAKAIVNKLWEEIPGLDQAGVEVREEIENWLSDQVVNAPADQLMRSLAIGQIATKVTEGQKVEIDRLTTEISTKDQKIQELEEKLSEQETFIKDMSSRSPRPSSLGGNAPSESESGSLLGKVRVHLPGR